MSAALMTIQGRLRGVLPTRTELVPWTDRRGRLHPLRATVFGLLFLPLLWLIGRWAFHDLGPEPVNAAIHSTGYWTVWLLLGSLVITPFKALAGLPNIVVIRRMIGNAALLYALLHLTLYATDQNWRIVTIVSEILKRFYLTIGFAALLGLLVLGLTSTDGWTRSLGKSWKRIHRVVYALMALGLVHYVLQSKLDVSQALLAAGVFSWLMLWRLLPSGKDRNWPALVGIGIAAALLTLAYEYTWYRFGTRVNPVKVITSEFDISYGLHPAGKVLLLAAAAAVVAELRRLSMTSFGPTAAYTMITFALGAFVIDGVAVFNGWSFDDILPDGLNPALLTLGGVVLFALLGFIRWRLREQPRHRWIDALWVGCMVVQVAVVGSVVLAS
jgi:sulfoxide reductase heme-binding subunit YedZ